MAIELYKDAVLTQDLPAHGLRAGDVGTVVDRHALVAGGDGISVEFFDLVGNTIAVVTVDASMLRSPAVDEVPSARSLRRRAG